MAYLGIDDDDDSFFLILQECDLEEPDGKMFSKCKVGVCTVSIMVQNAFCPLCITQTLKLTWDYTSLSG
jgi:hypothetical protein